MAGFKSLIAAAPPVLFVQKAKYLFRDRFTTARAAGTVNATASEPGPGTRTVADTESKLTIAGGLLSFAGGKAAPAWGDPSLWGPAVTRAPGVLLCGIKHPNVSGFSCRAGFDTAQTGDVSKNNVLWGTSPAFYYVSTRLEDIPGAMAMQFAVVLRAAGAFIFTKEVGGTTWRMRFISDRDSPVSTTLYPALSSYAMRCAFDYATIPAKTYSPPAAVSDGFNRADVGTLTDGQGHPEGNGGDGVTWVQQVGTWRTITSTLLAPLALAGGLCIITADAGSPNGLINAKLTRNAGTVGVVLRYVDASNYIYAYGLNDGASKAAVHKVVEGVDTEVLAPTAAGSLSGAWLRVLINGTKLRVFTGDQMVGGELTIDDAVLQTSGLSGVFATHTNVTCDSFVVFNQDGYTGLDSLFPTIKTILPFGDSKTYATNNLPWSGYPPLLASGSPYFVEYPTRIALGGTTVRDWATTIDASLAAAVGTPEVILCNLGVNDTRYETGTLHNGLTDGPPFDFATWQTNYLYILDAFHAKWPSAKIYLMRPWCRTADVATRPVDFAEMDNVRIPAIVAARSTFCFLGPDERIFLENGDDGATLTDDGVHPNALGNQVTAAQWRSVIG